MFRYGIVIIMLEELKKIGLSDNEAKVYFSILELGLGTAQEISKKSGVNRPTTYVQLENLMKMGIASTYEKEAIRKGGATKTMFRVESPEYLHHVISREKDVLKEKEIALQMIAPRLAGIFADAKEHPKVRFFEGIEGLKTMQDEFLKTNSRLIEGVASLDDVIKVFPSHPDEYAPRRVKRGIKARLLYTSKRGPFLKDFDARMLRESRFIPSEKFPFSSDITIYDHRVAISALTQKPHGIIIEDKEIANSIRALFYLAWDASEKYN